MLLVGGDLDGVFEPILEGLDLVGLAGELLLEFVDPGLAGGGVDGAGHLVGLAVERLA